MLDKEERREQGGSGDRALIALIQDAAILSGQMQITLKHTHLQEFHHVKHHQRGSAHEEKMDRDRGPERQANHQALYATNHASTEYAT